MAGAAVASAADFSVLQSLWEGVFCNSLMRTLKTLVVLLLCSALALAEGTQIWRQSKFDEFEKGSAKGVAIRSDGSLVLAPSFKLVSTTPSTYLWAMVADDQGNVYAAAGSPARVYRITPDGRATVIFKAQELAVQALAVAKDGALYAATSPDGKVYRIERKAAAGGAAATAPATESSEIPLDPAYSSSVFYDPQTKYIWDLALDREGRLYVATGEHGQIFRVTPAGTGSLFFQSDEVHIRVLAFDPKGNLIAGSDGSGLIYRISPAGEAFVLYSASKKEITALAVDEAGNIYAAGVGDKKPGGVAPGMPVTVPVATPAPTAPAVTQRPGAATPGAAGAAAATPFTGFFPGFTQALGSEVYEIAPDGSPKTLWGSREDIVYALGFDKQGRLLAGTGNKGHVYLIENDQEFTDLLSASANQVTAFAKAPAGGLYVSTSNLGKIFLLGAGPDSDGSYESDVFDARIFSLWGRAEVRGSGNFEFYARSGNVDNPDRNWSPWKKVDLAQGAALEVPASRFIQWKAVLHPNGSAPRIDNVGLNYLSKNVAPDLDDVSVQVGVRYITQPRPSGGEGTMVVSGGPATGTAPPKFEAPVPALRDRDSIGVRWAAHDDNEDTLVYSLYYRGDGETQWKLLKDGISDKVYSFDAGLLPDGGYTIKVVASDAPSHSPDEALSASLESDRFEVDNTPPAVEALNAVESNGELHVTFRAADSFSPIKRAEYSVDASDWQYIEPTGRLSDAKTENYDFHIPVPPAGPVLHHEASGKKTAAADEHVVVVRVYDRFENMGTGKVVVRGK